MWHQRPTVVPIGYECLICWSSVGSLCGRPVVPAPSWEWQEDRTDCDSIHCGSAPGLFLPPGSCWSLTLSKYTACHLSAYLPVPRGGAGKGGVVVRAESLKHFIWHVQFLFPVSLMIHETSGHPSDSTPLWAEGGHQFGSNAPLTPRLRGQEVGLGDKSQFPLVCQQQQHFASSVTFSIQRTLISNKGD